MANKQRDVKLTLADLIAKKAAKEARESRTCDLYVDSLEGVVTIQSPPRSIVYKTMDMSGESIADTVYANAFLVYHSVKLFQDAELLAAYEVKDNIDIVHKLLEPYEIQEIAGKVMELSGFTKPEKVQADLKN